MSFLTCSAICRRLERPSRRSRAPRVEHPSLESAWTYLGDTCFGLEDLPRAKAAYERSIAAYPQGRTADRARYGLARTLAVSGERDKALAMLEELAKKGVPDWVDRCWLQIGLIQESAGRLPEAVEAYQSLERVAPGSALVPEAQLHRAIALVRLGRKAEAEGLLRALATNGSEAIGPRAALELATIQLESQHPEAAFSTLEAALKRYPECPAVPALQFRSAEALQKQKRLAEAETRFLKVAEGFPDDAWADDALVRAAQSALDRGDFATAGRLAGRFPAQFGRSVLRSEARLIEARAAASSGHPKDAVAILETLVGATASSSTKPAGASKDGSAKADAQSRCACRFRRPWLNPLDLISPWRTGPWDDRLKPTPSSPSSRKGRPGRSRRMPNSWLASHTWTRDDSRKPSRRWNSTWPPTLAATSLSLPWHTW